MRDTPFNANHGDFPGAPEATCMTFPVFARTPLTPSFTGGRLHQSQTKYLLQDNLPTLSAARDLLCELARKIRCNLAKLETRTFYLTGMTY